MQTRPKNMVFRKPQELLLTPRLILRPFRLTDAVDLQVLVNDRAIADTTLRIPFPYDVGMAVEWIATHAIKFQAGQLCNYAITLSEDDTLTGAVGLDLMMEFERAELGYWIGRRFWNLGYCTEAASAMLAYGFRSLGLQRIHASHLTRNPASGRVMRKIGMRHEGCARRHVKKWGKFEDLELYGLLREEWQEASAAGGPRKDPGA